MEVIRDGDGWTADFRFPSDRAAWGFLRSPLTEAGGIPWRPQSWTVETPGISLQRRGHYDLLAAAPGRQVPRNVRIRFSPFPGRMAADYDPAIVMTDGSVALYSEQFDSFPLNDPADAETYPADAGAAPLLPHTTRVTFRDQNGLLLHAGRRRPQVTIDDDSGSFILFGPASPVSTEGAALIVDPQLPVWLNDMLRRSAAPLLNLYAERLGPGPERKPTIIVGWAGTGGHFSMGGGTLPGTIVMRFEGAGLLEPNPETGRTSLWFIAHEAAHFWLGETVRYASPRDGWITEGGADLLAMRAISSVDRNYDPLPQLQKSVEDCAALTRGRGVADAIERAEHRAYYACGALFALVAEAAGGEPFFDFVRALIAQHREDGVVTRSDWLDELDRRSGGNALRGRIERLIDHGSDHPAADIAALLRAAGIPFRPGADGIPVLT